jgi:hypothetical protein
MKNFFAALTLASVAIAACASQPTRKASESEILATTKQLTAKDCHPQGRSNVEHVSGCTYSPTFINGEWNVDVTYIMVDKNGKRLLPFGAGAMYFFDSAGKFIKIIGDQ